jgi:hypothetical protein
MSIKRPLVNYGGKLKEILSSDTFHPTNCQIILQDEGSSVATGSTLNFVGAGATASNVGGVLTVTIPGGGSSTATVQTLTGATSLGTTEAYSLCDGSTTGFTVTLPTAVGNSGLRHHIKKIDSSSNIITIASAGGTIDGSTTIQLLVSNKAETFISNGTNWYVF